MNAASANFLSNSIDSFGRSMAERNALKQREEEMRAQREREAGDSLFRDRQQTATEGHYKQQADTAKATEQRQQQSAMQKQFATHAALVKDGLQQMVAAKQITREEAAQQFSDKMKPMVDEINKVFEGTPMKMMPVVDPVFFVPADKPLKEQQLVDLSNQRRDEANKILSDAGNQTFDDESGDSTVTIAAKEKADWAMADSDLYRKMAATPTDRVANTTERNALLRDGQEAASDQKAARLEFDYKKLESGLTSKDREVQRQSANSIIQNLGKMIREADKNGEKVAPEHRRAYNSAVDVLIEFSGSPTPSAPSRGAAVGAKPGTAGDVPKQYIDYLRANPDSAASFDKKYGAGAAKKYLGQ